MATTIVTKYGSDAPAASDIVRGELAVDTENGRLYTENAAGAVVEIGLKPEANVDVTGTITATGTSVFTNLDISGDIDVDGTTNLDVVDIDGAVDMASTLGVAGIITATSSSSGDYVRLYGGSGTGKWDIYASGANLRFSDNESAGALQVDTAMAVLGVVTANAGVVVDNITIDGNEIDVSSGDLTLDVAGDIILDAAGGDIKFKNGSTEIGSISLSGSNVAVISAVQDEDIFFKGNDGGATIDALSLDISEGGAATFNAGATFGGNVGIGIAPTNSMHIKAAANTNPLRIQATTDDYNYATIQNAAGTDVGYLGLGIALISGGAATDFTVRSQSNLVFTSGGADEAARFDSSQTFLVGKTEDGISNAGHVLFGTGAAYHIRDGGFTNFFNRTSSDGEILRFAKDGTTVGNIGTHSASTYIGQGDTGLYFNNGNNSIDPYNTSTPAPRGDSISLGAASRKFADLHLSGIANLGYFTKIGNGTSTQTVGLLVDHGSSTGYNLIQAENDNGTWFSVAGDGVATFNGNLDVNGASTFNEGGADVDFRVESNDNASMLFVDGGNNVVNIGHATNTVGASSGTLMVNFIGNVANGIKIRDTRGEAGTNNMMVFVRGDSQVGSITSTTSATAYNTSSDYRLKENVVAMSGATERLKQLKPSRFNFIADADTTVDGFLAHEVQDIVPEAITGAKDAMMDEEYEATPAVLDDDGNVVDEAVMATRSVPDYQGIDQSKLVPLLVATIQELEARIAALES